MTETELAGLVEQQKRIVQALQTRLRDADTDRSGEVKDLAVALGVAVDKLAVLTELAAA